MLFNEIEFSEVVFADFEFRAPSGERPDPICLVARELNSNRKFRVWQDELKAMTCPPYSTGADKLFVSYFASAELGCYLSLGWSMPKNVLDLFAEFRVFTNGTSPIRGNGLLGALAHFELSTIESAEKDEMRKLALRGGPWSLQEKEALLAYCESDVAPLPELLKRMLPTLDIQRALLRGEYMKAVAQMEFNGIPIDSKALGALRTNWELIREKLIEEIDKDYGVYEGATFRTQKFADWLRTRGIPWPTLDSGALDLKQDTFKDMAKIYPELSPLKELRSAMGQLRLNDLAVGSDGRNRCLISPFQAKTGRNLPSSSRYIFGPSVWIRRLIKPEPEHAIAYIDWSQQEFGIAAVLSKDPKMIEAYQSGDPYWTFACQAGAVPPGAAERDYQHIRDQFKQCALAVQYGMGPASLANRINQPVSRAKELLRLHRESYKEFWRWSDGVVDYAILKHRLHTVFGWQIQANGIPNHRSLRNFPMQANGAEMLRLACCFALNRDVKVCGPIHDAILIEARIDELDEKTETAEKAMADASAAVLSGFQLRTDVKKVIYPEQYHDPRGERMWEAVWGVLKMPHIATPVTH